MFLWCLQVDVLQRESRKRLESESDSRKNQDKFMEELRSREQELMQQISQLKVDKQRLEDTIYRLKTESLTTSVTVKQLEENITQEKSMNVRMYMYMHVCVCPCAFPYKCWYMLYMLCVHVTCMMLHACCVYMLHVVCTCCMLCVHVTCMLCVHVTCMLCVHVTCMLCVHVTCMLCVHVTCMLCVHVTCMVTCFWCSQENLQKQLKGRRDSKSVDSEM